MAKLADAHGSGPCDRKVMEVQVLSSAQIKIIAGSSNLVGHGPLKAGIGVQIPVPQPVRRKKPSGGSAYLHQLADSAARLRKWL